MFKQAVNDVCSLIMNEWGEENENRRKQEMKEDSKKLQDKIEELNKKLNEDIDNLRQSYMKDMRGYKAALRTLNPIDQTTLTEIWKTVVTMGWDKFHEDKEKAQEMLKKYHAKRKKISEQMQKALDIKDMSDKVNQAIAEIPLKVEDKMNQIKNILDMILGIALPPLEDPEDMNFDVNAIIGKAMAVINPVLNGIAPIESLVGKVPILGDLAGIFSMISAMNSTNSDAKDTFMERFGNMMPDIPDNVLDTVKNILDDIWNFCIQLPMIMIDVIFQMIEVIIGMFEQIAGMIGVPEIPYPLSLIPTCISLTPKIKLLIKRLPKYVWAALKGTLKQKYAEIMSLSIPTPPLGIPDIDDGEADKPSCQSKPETKKIDYNDVIKDKLEQVGDIGYDRTDLMRILNSYKKIYDGSNGTLNQYIAFSGDSKYDTLWPSAKSTITRKQGTPEDFKAVLDSVFAGDIKEKVEYDAYKTTKSVMGALYNKYKKQVKSIEPNEELVVKEVIKP